MIPRHPSFDVAPCSLCVRELVVALDFFSPVKFCPNRDPSFTQTGSEIGGWHDPGMIHWYDLRRHIIPTISVQTCACGYACEN